MKLITLWYGTGKGFTKLRHTMCQLCGQAPAKKTIKGLQVCGKTHREKIRQYA